MKRILAIFAALCLLLCGCAGSGETSSTASSVRPTVTVTADNITKSGATLTVTVKDGESSEFTVEVTNEAGDTVLTDENSSGVFKLDGLLSGSNYVARATATVNGEVRRARRRVSFETKQKYGEAVARGIDVSRWQEDIDWSAVAADGIDFAILRAGFSGETDTYFEKNYAGANAAGVDVGVYFYCYADSVEEAERDAEYLIALLDGRPLSYPVFYDVEEEEGFLAMSREERTEMVDAFCKKIAEAGYIPGIYTGRYWLSDYLDSDYLRQNYDIWLAGIMDEPPSECSAEMWQYSHTGNVNGIKGEVDLNAAYKRY